MNLRFFSYLGTTVLFCTMFFSPEASTRWYPYISPGVKIGWNFSDGLSVTGKFSIGFHNDDNYSFVNFTAGTSKTRESRYFFSEIEGGYPFPVCPGGGVGVAWYKNEKFSDPKWSLHPKASFFVGGLFGWVRDDLIIGHDLLINDIGIMLTAPLSKYHYNLFPFY